MKCWVKIFVFLSLLLWPLVPAEAADKVGVVIMHGTKGHSGPKSYLAPLLRSFRKAGILYVAPDMPWSRRRHLSKTVEGSLIEIDKAVETLKARGATKIVVGGQSHGATAAMAYGGHRKGLAGILVIAPGHIPSKMGWQRRMDYDYVRAGTLIEKGKGKKKTSFKSAGKRVFTFRTTPEIYFSWYEPDGPTNYQANAMKMEQGTALFWIQGKDDKINPHGEYLAFAHAPKNPKNKYVIVKGGHLATPRIGASQIVAWLKSL
ncbi:MAG: alpha/beta hydrolase [Hyphomicrobiaceae bacterium]|nr:alpha/beta hydrolase [Hyphomicrobiaceae bacterium]